MDKMTSVRRSNIHKPLLIHSYVNNWPCISWNFKTLATLLGEKVFSCRISPRSCGQKMETQCIHHNVSVEQFNDWLMETLKPGNPLESYKRAENSCYIDYKYMKDMFSEHPKMFEEVPWKEFGLNDFNGYDSTIWLSSDGANTPGHQDSYGFNLVTQLHGRKLWILFPPEDLQYMYPTRVPYEESSVFTQVNVRKPNLEHHPLFKSTHPVIVTLSPGQTLYVPRHWWHYVESLEPSISVNLWVPVDEDRESHLHEAITRLLATSLISALDTTEDSSLLSRWLNPTESLAPNRINLMLLKTALNQLNDDTDIHSNTSSSGDRQESMRMPESVDSSTRSCNASESIRQDKPGESGEVEISEADSEEKIDSCRQNVDQSIEMRAHHTCTDAAKVKSCGDQGSYLNLFMEKIKNFTFTNVTTPFAYNSTTCKLSAKRKLKTDELYYHKKFKSGSGHDEHFSIPSLESSSDETNSSSTSSQPGIFILDPCTFETYIHFLDDLCLRNRCSRCYEDGRIESGNKVNDSSITLAEISVETGSKATYNTEKSSTDTEGKHPKHLTTSTSTASCVHDTSVSSGQHSKQQNHPLGNSDKDATNSSQCMSGNESEREINAAGMIENEPTPLSLSDIAEILLSCTLHPEIVEKISVLFKQQCEDRVRQNRREEN